MGVVKVSAKAYCAESSYIKTSMQFFVKAATVSSAERKVHKHAKKRKLTGFQITSVSFDEGEIIDG